MRRDKTSLLLMEQLVTLLVFALAAAICLQAFVTADRRSRRMEARDRAAVLCQNTAETLRHNRGDFAAAGGALNAQSRDGDSLTVFYDADWQPADAGSPNVYPLGYTLGACRVETGVPGLGKAAVWAVEDETGEELFRLETAWQEVMGDE